MLASGINFTSCATTLTPGRVYYSGISRPDSCVFLDYQALSDKSFCSCCIVPTMLLPVIQELAFYKVSPDLSLYCSVTWYATSNNIGYALSEIYSQVFLKCSVNSYGVRKHVLLSFMPLNVHFSCRVGKMNRPGLFSLLLIASFNYLLKGRGC